MGNGGQTDIEEIIRQRKDALYGEQESNEAYQRVQSTFKVVDELEYFMGAFKKRIDILQ